LYEVMDRQVRQLMRLVDDLLDVSRATQGKIALQTKPVRLQEVIATAVETARPLIELRRHALEVAVDRDVPAVLGDAARLAQVLGNLLNNAAKYTDPGGEVWVTVERDGEEVVLRVRDTGIGIRPDMLPHIFDLFVQAERRLDRAQGGVGIGLTLVRRLVEMHGGTVSAASKGPGHGSEFAVRLPAVQEESNAARGGRRTTEAFVPSAASRRVLVVDDNVDAANSLALLLKLSGHDVQAAYDGPSALLVAETFHPQLVLLDIGMPGMDGYEVARRLRKQQDHQTAVLAALTGWGQEEDRRRAMEAGFDYHFVKPIEPDALEQLLALPAR
jgi:CheY-like chemotaxis protein/two-component sensor histidine kinase